MCIVEGNGFSGVKKKEDVVQQRQRVIYGSDNYR
jgi:hypothetical protein